MAGAPMELLTGGSGMYQNSAAARVAPQGANGAVAGSVSPAAHHGPICLVLVALLVLFLLDRAGFRFAVTAGRR